MTPKKKPCEAVQARAYRDKAQAFLRAAEIVEANAGVGDRLDDAVFSLLVHAGIAASDALCCAGHHERSSGDDHREALAMLRNIRPNGAELEHALSDLLASKSTAEYSPASVTAARVTAARRRAKYLVSEAVNRVA